MSGEFNPGDRVFMWDSPSLQGTVVDNESIEHRTRYSSEEAALRGHLAAVDALREGRELDWWAS